MQRQYSFLKTEGVMQKLAVPALLINATINEIYLPLIDVDSQFSSEEVPFGAIDQYPFEKF